MIDLDAIKERLAKATPGPWAVCKRPANSTWVQGGTIGSVPHGSRVADTCVLGPNYAHDAAFIAHAPTDIAALVAEVERLRREVDDMSEPWILPAMETPHDPE